MKVTVLIFCLFVFVGANAQSYYGMDSIRVNSTYKALMLKPSDYDSNSPKRYGLIVGLGGNGQEGTQLSQLFGAGIPRQVSLGRPMYQVMSPGDTARFLYVCPLVGDARETGQPNVMNAFIDYMILHYHVDTTKIMVTGLSQGANNALAYALWPPTGDPNLGSFGGFDYRQQRIKCYVIGSPPYLDAPFTTYFDRFRTYGWGARFFHGSSDGGLTDPLFSQVQNDSINAEHPGSSQRFLLSGYGHNNSVWDSMYSTLGTDSNRNIYRWFVQRTSGTPTPPSCVTNINPTNAAVLTTTNTASLTWNTASGASSYYIYLWSGGTIPGSPTDSTTATSYSAAGLSAATQYHWFVVPKNAVGIASGCVVDSTRFTTAAVSTTGTGLHGDYYNGNTSLTGTPVLSRTDTTVNYPFSYSSFVPGVVAQDVFSARWTGKVQAQYTQTYKFYTQSDDGVRLWVNGTQLINNWTGHGSTTDSGSISLTAGQQYDITLEYFQNTGGATIQLSWSSPSTPKAIIPKAQLYPDGTMPPPCTSNSTPSNASTISTSLTATLTWNAASTATGYDVYLWTGSTIPSTPTGTASGTSYSATGLSSSTTYKWFVVPKNTAGSATGCVIDTTSFTTSSATGVGLHGDYYNGNTSLTGTLVLSRTDTTVNYPFSYTSFVPGVVAQDVFSARWTGKVQAQYTETYKFYTQSDDGVRLWVNGTQLINNWTGHGSTTDSGSISLTAGQQYDITLEYFQNTGGATIQLSWASPSTVKTIIPKSQLYLPSGGRYMALPTLAVQTDPRNRPLMVVPMLQPNPVQAGQLVNFKLSGGNSNVRTVQVISSDGKIISSKRINVSTGINTLAIDTHKLSSGLYIVQIKDSSTIISLKLIVQ